MGSSLSPVISNFYMEAFEEEALRRATYKPLCWFSCVVDTFVIWPHGREKLDILPHLNNIQTNIEFTMETEREMAAPS
jgi:hypothetical protein